MLTETQQYAERPSPSCVGSPAGSKGLKARQFFVLLLIAIVAAFPTVVLGARTFFYRDFGAMWYPIFYYTRQSFLHGQLPLWNPYIHCGVPFQAQMGLWYPPLLLSMVLPMPWAINILALLHLLWAGLGTFWVIRRWGYGSFAASFGGMAYAFNGVMLSSLLWISTLGGLAWLPWLVGCVVEAWKHGGRWSAKAILCAAVQVLAGAPEITVLTWLLVVVVWIALIGKREIEFIQSVRRVSVIIALAAGISMIQMLPFLDLLTHSQRNQNTATADWSMPLWGWANLLVPLFHCYQAPTGLFFQAGQDLFPSYYLGLTVLCIGLTAPFLIRTRMTALLVALAFFCWIMALGPNGILYTWIRQLIPAVGVARFPVKFTILPAFLLPLLAAFTIHRLQSYSLEVTRRYLSWIAGATLFLMGILLWLAHAYPYPNDRWNLLAWNTACRGALMLIALALLFFTLRIETARLRLILQLALLAIIPLDAITHSPNIAPTLPYTALAPGVWQSGNKCPAPRIGEGRIMLSPQADQQLLFSHVADLELDFAGKRIGEWYNLNLLDEIPKVNGALPLRPAHFDQVEHAIYFASGTRIGSGLFDFLSVAAFSPQENPLNWLPRTDYLPVVTAGQLPVFASDELVLRSITSDNFDPRAVVYLPENAGPFVAATNTVTCSVENMRFGAQRIEADTDSPAPTLVVLSQSFYHLWRAFVDDKPAPLLRANLAFQAIPIPGGKHHVKLVYKDRNLAIGSIISMLSLLMCGYLCFRKGA
jgi:hypothetical protein